MGKKIFFISLFLLAVLSPASHVCAGTYDNAYSYYKKFGDEQDSPARYNEADGYIYFCSRGLTASNSTRYRTVGYTITINVGGKTDRIEVMLGGTYVKDVSEVKKDSYTYVLRRAKLSRLLTLFNGNNRITWNEIYRNKNTYTFDAIMTVVENDKQLCGRVNESGDYRTITAAGNSYLFRTAAGIKTARKWKRPGDLDSFFNKSVVFPANNYIATRNMYANGVNVYNADGVYYVKSGADVNIAFESYFNDMDAAVKMFHPNYNIYGVTGWGDNQKYYTMQRRSGSNAPYSGIIKDGTTSEKPLTLKETRYEHTTSYSDCNYAFTSMVTFGFNVPDSGIIYVKPEGRVYYNYTYPDTLDDKDYLCDKSQNDSLISLVSDGRGPDVYIPDYISSIGAGYIPVSAYDSGSGVKNIAVCRSDGAVISEINYTGRNTAVSSEKDFYIKPETGYDYYVRAVDNLGNVTYSGKIVFLVPKSHTVSAIITGDNNGYNANNITTDVYGGSSEIASLVIMSEDIDNPMKQRVVFVNKDVMSQTLSHGLYTYRHSFNPMDVIKNMPDGYYGIDVISGGMYVESKPVRLRLKKDTTKPVINVLSSFDDNKWYRNGIRLNIAAKDNYSGIYSVGVKVNKEEVSGETYFNPETATINGSYSIDDEGVNMISIAADDAAGNHSYIIRHYRIDKTSPTMIYSDLFTGLNVSNNKWINKEAMYSNIYAYDELSGLSETSKIHLYEVKDSTKSEVDFNTPVVMKCTDSKNGVINFTDAFIDTLDSSRKHYVVQISDVAGNITNSDMYVNLDFDMPYADITCNDGWNKYELKGNVCIADVHSGVSSIEVYRDGVLVDSYYNVKSMRRIIYVDQSEYKGKTPVIYIKMTDYAGNVADYILATEKGAILLDADITRIDGRKDAVFLAGERGILRIWYSGDAEIIRVFYPENMTALNPLLNKEYNVSGKTSLNVSTGFIIPIGTDEGPYHVTVKAYKGDKEYTVYPTFEVYGCVTEQFRTRLRR